MRSPIDRRAFLTSCAAAGLPLTVAERSWATLGSMGHSHDTAQLLRITKEQVAAAEKVLGLSFSDADRDQMLGHLEEALRAYATLEKAPIPNDVPPAFRFDPVPAGETAGIPPAGAVRVREAAVPTIATDADLGFATIAELGALLRTGRLTVRALTERTLSRLERLNPDLNAVVTLTAARALHQADLLDAEATRGEWRGPLHGIPWGAKDLLAVPDYPTTWGTPMYRKRTLPETAAVVERLDAAGAVLVAKLALGELAYGDLWYGGRTRNPWRVSEGASGSSAGSAAAVAAGMLPFAIGSETLGSILAPATRCGVSGLRPTYGRVSRFGAMSLAWTLDKLGPIARSAEDLAVVFAAIQGEDARDPSSHPMPFAFDPDQALAEIRVGLHPDLLTGDAHERPLVAAAVETLRRAGVGMRPVAWPTDIPTTAMDIIMRVEGAAAFEEIVAHGADDRLVDQGVDARPNVLRAAHFIPAVQYVQANRVRTLTSRRVHAIFTGVDVILVPPMTETALATTNLTGHPAVTVPIGGPEDGAQQGLTIIGALWREDLCLRMAHAWQMLSNVHRRRPPAFD
ncbi:MAG TPA: amidase [Gemmatimonadales bacterium]|nr:amidase [Gemmatimonadales bacterium]